MEKEFKDKTISEKMEVIQESMFVSNEKKDKIKEMEDALMEETRIMVAEKQKEEITDLKKGKEEFDEITINALINTKSDILKERKKLEEGLVKKTEEYNKKNEEIDKKLQIMKNRNIDNPEEMKKIIEIAERKKAEAKSELEEYQTEYKNNIKDLAEWDKQIDKYAYELKQNDKKI